MPVVLTIATDDYAARWRFCLDSQAAYADRFGFSHVVEKDRLPGLNPKWSKLAYCQAILARGEDLLLIDADAEISREAPAFTSALSDHPGADILFVNGISGRPNSGVLIMRGGTDRAAHALMNACLSNRDTPVPKEDFVTTEGENGHILHFLKQPPFAGRAAALPLAWNCTVGSGFDAAFVRHYTNELRRRLKAGDFWSVLSTPLSVGSQAEGHARGLALAHAWDRDRAVATLTDDPARLDAFRQLVLAIGDYNRLAFAPLPHDQPGAWMERYELATGLVEAAATAAALRTVGPGAVVLDGGAGVGSFARAVHSRLGGDCRILAVEADPANLEPLAANLGAAAEILRCTLGPGDVAGPTPTRAIDLICAERGVARLDLVRLDLGGLELQALLGAGAIIDNSPDLLIQVRLDPGRLALNSTSADDVLTLAYRSGLVTRMCGADFAFRPAGFVDEKRAQTYFMARPQRWAALDAALFGEPGTAPRWEGPGLGAEAPRPAPPGVLRAACRRLAAAVGLKSGRRGGSGS